MANGERPMANAEFRILNLFAIRVSRLTVLSGLFCLSLVGCKPAAPPEPASAKDSAERGPIKFSVTATPAEAWIGDPITIAMTANAPEDIAVEFPNQTALGEANVRSAGTPTSRPSESGGVWQQSFVIDTLATGTLEIPPLVMKYGKKPSAGGTPEFDNELAIGTLKVAIRSALTSQDSMTAPRDISGARTPLPEPWKPWQIAVLFVSCVIGLLAILLLARVFIRWRNRPAPPLAAEIWALRELDKLSKHDWAGTGQVRECYYRLTEIVRGYIEKKFGLRAPEMTTEEFLRVLARNQSALPYDAERLRGFLESCDMVKYAAVNPQREEIDGALSQGRAFVNATAAAFERHVQQALSESRTSVSGQLGQHAGSALGPSASHGIGTGPSPTVVVRNEERNPESRWMGSSDDHGGRAA